MNPVYAVSIADDLNIGTGTIGNVYPSLSVLINVILKNSLTIIGTLLLILLLIGGIQFIMSAGSDDPKKAQAAKTMITDAIIGFIVVLSTFFIVQIVQVITGLNILNSPF